PVQMQGRLSDPAEFEDTIIKVEAGGAVTRVKDVGRAELTRQDLSVSAYSSGGLPTIGMAIIAQPETNELAAANGLLAELEAMLPEFPPGVTHSVPYNPTEFVESSIGAVQKTLFEAVLLVVVVIVVFLQTWRAAIIPIVVIPVALIGAMTALLLLGYSLNSLALFALVLAVGIVVDDAIVVVENVERNIRAGLTP